MKEFIEITIELSLQDVERNEEGFSYKMKWLDGKVKIIQSLIIKFATETIADAMFTINGLLVLHPNTKNFSVKRR